MHNSTVPQEPIDNANEVPSVPAPQTDQQNDTAVAANVTGPPEEPITTIEDAFIQAANADLMLNNEREMEIDETPRDDDLDIDEAELIYGALDDEMLVLSGTVTPVMPLEDVLMEDQQPGSQ